MSIDISIVSGTYNRLPYLKRMVGSVRRSIGPLTYEIVLVDGGSTDGTIEWCKRQNDVRLIEQGKLLGAVKAFNAGAMSSKANYVILANDDIEFVGMSILSSWSFMEDFEEVGVGCFYQDRNKQNWHVEQMPAVGLDGRQISVPYGQVCIVPTHLGNSVGWWGDYLHTYGGDNELSCNVLEKGYEVCPVPNARIHDFSSDLDDELRKINNNDPRTMAKLGRTHPDSAKWSRKWSRGGKVGPRLTEEREDTQLRHHSKKMRILYAPIYEPGNQLQKRTKVGLRKALQKVGVVLECDFMSEGFSGLRSKGCSLCPDLFILQLQDASVMNLAKIRILREDHPEAVFVSWNGDYHPGNLYDAEYMAVMKEIDYAGFAVASIKDTYDAYGINWFYWQIGYEESYGEPDPTEVSHDVVFLGNGYTEFRKELARFLVNLQSEGINVGLYGSWDRKLGSLGSNLYDFDSGRRIYRRSKLAISDQQWPDATGYVSNRLFQAMEAGGAMVLQQKFDGMAGYLGLTKGVHLDIWENFDDLKEKIKFWLKEDRERERIAKNGHEFMLENHSFDVRVRELMDVLGK